ncbi:MAG: STAS domain-containing protein [Solirubrobacterales bacterium]|nr:STAS domain-containing protein [Solirubrobacterales bacterium]
MRDTASKLDPTPVPPNVHSHLRVEVRSEPRATVLAVSGELDLASSPALEEALERVRESDPATLILDLRELVFIDSTGLSVLVKADQRARETGKRFGLVNGPSQVQRLLVLTGLTERLTMADTPEELLSGD